MVDTSLSATVSAERRSGFARAVDRVRHVLTDRSDEGVARRTALFAFAVRIASAAIAYLSQIILARWMGTAEYGIYVFVWTWVLILGNLSGLGFGMASSRFIPEHADPAQHDLFRGYLVVSRATALVAGTVVALLGAGLVTALGTRLESPFLWPLVLALVCLPLFALSETQDGIGRALNAPAVALVPPYVLRPLLMLVLMIAAHAGGLPATASTAVLAAIAGTWTAAVVQVLALDRKVRATVGPGPRRYTAETWFGTSVPLCVADGARVFLLNIDVLLLALFVPPDRVGIYFAVTKTLVLGAFVAFAVGAAAAHRYAEYHVAGDRERLQAFLSKSATWIFWPTLAAALGMALLGRLFLWLFGDAFVEGYGLMLILSVGLLGRAALGPTDRLLAALGEHNVYAQGVVGTLGFAIGMNMLLIPFFGATGAAVAMASAMVFEGVLLARIARNRLGLRPEIWGGWGGRG